MIKRNVNLSNQYNKIYNKEDSIQVEIKANVNISTNWIRYSSEITDDTCYDYFY